MAITSRNQDNAPKNTWEIKFGARTVIYVPKGGAEAVVEAESIGNLLRNASTELNNGKNRSVHYTFKNGNVKLMGFLNNIDGIKDLDKKLKSLKPEHIVMSMTLEEMEEEWNNA